MSSASQELKCLACLSRSCRRRIVVETVLYTTDRGNLDVGGHTVLPLRKDFGSAMD